MSLQHLQTQARQAILRNKVAAYKRRGVNWQQQPAIKKAVLLDTLGSWPTLIIVSVSGLIAAFALTFQKVSYGLAVIAALGIMGFGFLSTIVWTWFNLNRTKPYDQVLVRLLERHVNFWPGTLTDPQLKARLVKALQYWEQIDQLARTIPAGPARDRVLAAHRETTHWLEAIYQLASRIDALQLNLARDKTLRHAPAALEQVLHLLTSETDSRTRRELEETRLLLTQRVETRQGLQANILQGNLQLSNTLTALGTVYAQLLLIATKGQQEKQTLRADIFEEVHRLRDITEAMDEVYARR